MYSKEQIIEKVISSLQKAIEKQFKRHFFRIARRRIAWEHRQLLDYVCQQNQNKLSAFLNADKFQYDDKDSYAIDDKQVHPQQYRFTCMPIRISCSGRPSAQIDQVRNQVSGKLSYSSGHSRSYAGSSLTPSQISIKETPSTLMPLWAQGWIEENKDEEEQDFANRIRERKTKRQIFKTRFQQTELLKRKTFDKSKQSQDKTKPKPKKDKFNYIQHFVDMEISLQQPYDNESKDNRAAFDKKLRGIGIKKKTQHQSLKTSPIKHPQQRHLLYTTRKWEPLISQSRQLILKDSEEIKLSSGVTIRQSLSKPNNNHASTSLHHSNSNTTRKKIQLLKNSQGKPMPLKFNELMSYKRLGSYNHLAYCSSMKTVKDIKEGTETNISIDSKQFMADEPDSKTLIKIANRRVFEQLMLEEQANENSRKTKMRLKKEGRVRFENMARA